jgi:hypothetical protein
MVLARFLVYGERRAAVAKEKEMIDAFVIGVWLESVDV